MSEEPAVNPARGLVPPRRRELAWQWSETDGHRALTWLAVVGLAAGAGLAVLGLPGADLHGPLHRLGIMDPLCGATRGVRLTFLGDLTGAWRYNPAAIPLTAGTWLVVARGVMGMLTRRWINVTLIWTRPATTAAIVLVIILWANQQLHAPLLLARF